MVYVKRDNAGNIIAASLESGGECEEELEASVAELSQFSQKLAGKTDALVNSDLPMVRVLDDLIDVLVSRGVIRFTDFPDEAQRKLVERRSLREKLDSLKLFGDDIDELL